ncbi:hypothetical protein ACO0QE_004682 [Hanseniaspora vineae]
MSGAIGNFVKGQIEGQLQDYGLEKWNDIAGKKLFKLKDPFRDVETNKRLKLPHELNPSKQDDKLWRSCQNKAWRDDKCFCSYFGFYMDCCFGIGMCPLVVLIPTIGPFLMYFVHNKLIRMVQKKRPGLIDNTTLAKMHANITFDLLISLPPIIGIFFTWLNGCSTRNCVLIYDCMIRDLQAKMPQNVQQVQQVQQQQPQFIRKNNNGQNKNNNNNNNHGYYEKENVQPAYNDNSVQRYHDHDLHSDLDVQSIPMQDFQNNTSYPNAPSKTVQTSLTPPSAAAVKKSEQTRPVTNRRVPPPGHNADPLSL